MFKIPSPEETMKELASILPFIYGALDHAIQKAKVFFEREDPEERVDRTLAPSLIRYWTKQYLEIHALDARDEEALEGKDQDYMVRLPNIGLCLNVGRCQIRILKSDDGELPIPGSRGRQEFYDQPNLPYPEDENEKPTPLKLLLLWNVTESYNLDFLSMACPMSGRTTRASVRAHWHERIPDVFLGTDRIIDVMPEHPSEAEPMDLPLLIVGEEKNQLDDEQVGEIG